MPKMINNGQCIVIEFESGTRAMVRAQTSEDVIEVIAGRGVGVRVAYDRAEHHPRKVPPSARRDRMHEGGK